MQQVRDVLVESVFITLMLQFFQLHQKKVLNLYHMFMKISVDNICSFLEDQNYFQN